ncbi:hypothetical protein AAG570_000747 [Ranatra chinensis]|uniref:Uncharacterized protein n=1 Tax=Ranatra chinensis TaxID=642074 RepID=A0ABD0ZL91_9HEMI
MADNCHRTLEAHAGRAKTLELVQLLASAWSVTKLRGPKENENEEKRKRSTPSGIDITVGTMCFEYNKNRVAMTSVRCDSFLISPTMSVNGEYENYLPVRDAFNEVHNAFRIKQNTVQLTEEKLRSLCEKSDVTVKEIEKARTRKYCLENYLKMTEYRLKEYDNRENECRNEFEKTQATDRLTIDDELKNLYDTNNAITHELENIKKDLNSLKSSFNLEIPYNTNVIPSCNDNRTRLDIEIKEVHDKTGPLIQEGEELQQLKTEYDKKLAELKNKVNN